MPTKYWFHAYEISDAQLRLTKPKAQRRICENIRLCAFHGFPPSYCPYSFRRLGFIGNQPFRTRSRWSKTSLILQKEEKAKTPNKEDKAMLSTNRQVTIPASPRKRKNHQQHTPK